MKRIIIILLTVALALSLSSCGTSGVIPSGINISQDEMNSYLKNYSDFVGDSEHVYFSDRYFNYSFSPDTGDMQKTRKNSVGEYYDGIIIKDILFTNRGQMLKSDNIDTGWRLFGEVDIDGKAEQIWPDLTVFPHGTYVYFLYRPSYSYYGGEVIIRAPINKIKETDSTSSLNGKEFMCLEFFDSEIVFQEDGLDYFGIYGDKIIAATQNADIWVIDINTCVGSRVVEGIEYYGGSKRFAVNGDYIYYSNDVDAKFERIKIDGTGRETFLEGQNGSYRDLFTIQNGYLYHVDSNGSGEKCLLRTNLDDIHDQIVIAAGAEQGVSYISETIPYIKGEWAYYGSLAYGYWRAKTDGTCVELITYAAYSENEPQWDAELFEKHSIAAGYEHTVAIRDDGTVVAVEKNDEGQCDVSEWTDIVSVYAKQGETIGIKSDGTFCGTDGLPDLYGLTNSISFDLQFGATLAVKADGTVNGHCSLGWGAPGSWTEKVESWTDIVAATTSASHTLGLKSNGTVVAAGENYCGQCNVQEWSDIIAVAVGSEFSVGLRSDGTVVTAGKIQKLEWTNVVSISAESDNVIGLLRDGTVVTNNEILSDWTEIVEVCAGGTHYVGVRADGTVLSSGENIYGQCDTEEWSHISVLD